MTAYFGERASRAAARQGQPSVLLQALSRQGSEAPRAGDEWPVQPVAEPEPEAFAREAPQKSGNQQQIP